MMEMDSSVGEMEEEESEDFAVDNIKVEMKEELEELEDVLGDCDFDEISPGDEGDEEEVEEEIKQELSYNDYEDSTEAEPEEDPLQNLISPTERVVILQYDTVVSLNNMLQTSSSLVKSSSPTENSEEDEDITSGSESHSSSVEGDTMGEVIRPSGNMTTTTGQGTIIRDPPANNAFVPPNSKITVNTANGTFTLEKFLYAKSLCRVCLLQKEETRSILENVAVDGTTGVIENARGPNGNHYSILEALKILVDIDVRPGDGLPTQICPTCLDTLLNFSVFRKMISLGQNKLKLVVEQVAWTSLSTIIPPFGEQDFRNANIYKYSANILSAQQILKSSKSCHLVMRNISDRVWDKIFQVLSTALGRKSEKLKDLSMYISDKPYVIGCLCTTCNEFIHGSLEDFAKHRKDVHSESDSKTLSYPCDICGSSFLLEGSKETYLFHWLEHFFMNPCDICNKRFPSARSLCVHKIGRHRADVTSLVCTLCHKGFKKRTHLDAHVKTHSDVGESEICHICGATLTTSWSTHMKQFHPSEDRYWQCEVCNKTFGRQEDLDAHKETVQVNAIQVNANVLKYQCETCGEGFRLSASRDLHVLKKHKNEQPFSCSTCGKRFFSKSSLASHAVLHNERTIHCPEPGCGKSFKRKLYLQEHLRVHSGDKPYNCDICGRSVRMKSNFYKHMKIHKREKQKAKVKA